MYNDLNPYILQAQQCLRKPIALNAQIATRTVQWYELELVKAAQEGSGIASYGLTVYMAMNKNYFKKNIDLRECTYFAFHVENLLNEPLTANIVLHIKFGSRGLPVPVRMRKVLLFNDDGTKPDYKVFHYEDNYWLKPHAAITFPALFSGWLVVPCTSYNIENFEHLSNDGCFELIQNEDQSLTKSKAVCPDTLGFYFTDDRKCSVDILLADSLFVSDEPLPRYGETFPAPAFYPTEYTYSNIEGLVWHSSRNPEMIKLRSSQKGRTRGKRSAVISKGPCLYPAAQGVLYVKRPGYRLSEFGPYSSYVLVFDSSFNPDKVYLYKQGVIDLPGNERTEVCKRFDIIEKLPVRIEVQDYNFYENLFKNIIDLSLGGDLEQIQAKIYLVQLILQLYKETVQKRQHQISDGGQETVEKIKRYIEGHYSSDITLGVLSDLAGVSPEHICRIFKQATSLSPMQYIKKVRVARAKEMLADTTLPIEQIACDCGFLNPSSFYETFKQFTNTTPAKYRQFRRS